MSDLDDDDDQGDPRFTDRTRRILWLSRNEAMRLGQNSVGTEHLLLGLIYEEEGIAATFLDRLGVDLAQLRRSAETMGRFVRSARGVSTSDFTEPAEHVLEMAVEEAHAVGHTHVGSGELLVALLREDRGVAWHALNEQGLELEAVREGLRKMLAPSPPPVEWKRILRPDP